MPFSPLGAWFGKLHLFPSDRASKLERYGCESKAIGVLVAFPVQRVPYDRVTDHFEVPPQLMVAPGYQLDLDGAGAVGVGMGLYGKLGQRRFAIQG